MPDPVSPGLAYLATVSIPLTSPALGYGRSARRTRPLIRVDGVAEIDAKYLIETERGERVVVRNAGIARRGPDGLYFRTSPVFETEVADPQWLMQHVFIGTGAFVPAGVELRWYEGS